MTYQRHRPTNRSSIDMLRRLPSVFGLKDVETMFDMTSREAVKAIGRWKENGFAHPLGPRTGVYYNRFLSPDSDDTKLALDRILRLPYVVIGMNALRHGQWTTQRGGVIEIGVPVTARIQSHPKVDGMLFCPRPAGWVDRVYRHASAPSDGIYGLPTLPPEHALVDMVMSMEGLLRKDNQVWHAAPDDILPMEDDPAEVVSRCRKAAEDMDAPLDKVRAYLGQIPDLADHIDAFDGEGAGMRP